MPHVARATRGSRRRRLSSWSSLPVVVPVVVPGVVPDIVPGVVLGVRAFPEIYIWSADPVPQAGRVCQVYSGRAGVIYSGACGMNAITRAIHAPFYFV